MMLFKNNRIFLDMHIKSGVFIYIDDLKKCYFYNCTYQIQLHRSSFKNKILHVVAILLVVVFVSQN